MSTTIKRSHHEKNTFKTNVLLLLLVVIIAVIPLIFRKNAEFSGADAKAQDVIALIKPDYTPWFHSLWVPPSGEIESLLFALQAGIGCLIIGYCIGFIHGRKKKVDSKNK